MFFFFQARKRSRKINFLGPETARWGGGLPREGVVAENFVPALETLSSLGFGERNPGCPGNFAGMSRTPGGVQKVCAKKLRAHFSFPIFLWSGPGKPNQRKVSSHELFAGAFRNKSSICELSACFREEKTITHHAFFRKIFRKIGQKSKQQKTHISVAKCVRCFKDPAHLRLARPISCIFSVGRVHHESLHGGVRKFFTFHRKIASIFHRKMVCVFLSAAGKLVNIFHRKIFPFSSHVV